jgi:hypothetical protein
LEKEWKFELFFIGRESLQASLLSPFAKAEKNLILQGEKMGI